MAPWRNPDNDALPNIEEYFFGTDPTAARASPTQSQMVGGHLTLTFPRNTAATDVTATAQGADSLTGTWTDLARSTNDGAFTTLVTGAGVTETGTSAIRSVTFQDAYVIPDASHPDRFLRLKVQ